MKGSIFGLVLTITFFGCSREIDCKDPPIVCAFISFPQNSLDTIVYRKYVVGTNFQNLIDTVYITQQQIRLLQQRTDTTNVILNDPDLNPKPGFDWQIFVPAVNRTISISDISKIDKTTKCAVMQMPVKCLCYDEIMTLKVDNQPGVLQKGVRNTDPGIYTLFIR